MTLYTFDKDKDGMSVCYGGCARNWPPLLAPAGAEAEDDFGLTARKDGSMQWTYYDMPLYLWINDKAPGDVSGDGKGGVWHIAQPQE
jgi:predicted lipoprotein with Yx(FWY)xxD motif